MSFLLCLFAGERARQFGWGWRGAPSPLSLDFEDNVLEEPFLDQPDFHLMLYHGLGSLAQNAKKADILLLGNSRLEFAVRDDAIRRFEHQTGLRVFNMALESFARYPYALEIIKRYHLHPALVVINEDDYFRDSGWSRWELESRESGVWTSLYQIMDHRLSWAVRAQLHRWIPKFSAWDSAPPEPVYMLRSQKYGAIEFENYSSDHYPLAYIPQVLFHREEYLENTSRVKGELKGLGLKFVLMIVPCDDKSKIVHDVARLLEVPAILPEVRGLETFDHSHLTQESADRFATAFFNDLLKLKVVQNLAQARKSSANSPTPGTLP
jgi:hypothetical protein